MTPLLSWWPVKAKDVPPCEDGKDHDWQPVELDCIDCGTHDGLYCALCYEMIDFIWDEDPRGI